MAEPSNQRMLDAGRTPSYFSVSSYLVYLCQHSTGIEKDQVLCFGKRRKRTNIWV